MILALAALVLAQPLAGHSLVYSARNKAVLLIGGDAAEMRPVYKLEGASWVALPNSSLPARSLAAVAADPAGNVLMHGGAVGHQRTGGGIDFKVTSETWFWNGRAWKLLSTSGPSPRDHHAMVYDSDRKRYVLFGGSDADPSGRSEFFGDTWEWFDNSWHRVATTGPSKRCHFAMAYDPVHKKTVLVGGYGPRGGDGNTWTWDGATWKVAANGAPADRSSPRMAWSNDYKQVLLFGGESHGETPSDTWAWNGAAWKRIAASGPPGRTVHGLAYDPVSKALVVYGGASGNDVLEDISSFRAGRWSN